MAIGIVKINEFIFFLTINTWILIFLLIVKCACWDALIRRQTLINVYPDIESTPIYMSQSVSWLACFTVFGSIFIFIYKRACTHSWNYLPVLIDAQCTFKRIVILQSGTFCQSFSTNQTIHCRNIARFAYLTFSQNFVANVFIICTMFDQHSNSTVHLPIYVDLNSVFFVSGSITFVRIRLLIFT